MSIENVERFLTYAGACGAKDGLSADGGVLPDGAKFRGELIDPWAMTATPLPGLFSGKSAIELSGKPYQAVRFRKV